jgi:hypothetical protein
MPLARIITDIADDSLELTMQLRARGFQVETVAPGQTSTTRADLEVRLEECAAEDVLTRAETSEANDLWVFIAPGVLDESARPVRAIPRLPRGEEAKRLSAILPTPITQWPSVLPPPGSVQRDQDLLLAQLLELRLPRAAGENAEPQPATVDAVSQPAHRALSEEVVPPASDVSDQSASVDSDHAAAEQSARVPARVDATRLSRAQIPAIPVAPEPVAEFVILPAPDVVRRPRPRTRPTNLRSWRVAFISATLVFSAWWLMGVLRPDKVPAPATATWLQASPGPGLAQAPALVPSERPAPRQARASRAKTLAPSKRPRLPLVAKSPRKARRPVYHSKGDGLIAEDTVVFYDRKPASPRAKAQAEPAPKKYSDQN